MPLSKKERNKAKKAAEKAASGFFDHFHRDPLAAFTADFFQRSNWIRLTNELLDDDELTDEECIARCDSLDRLRRDASSLTGDPVSYEWLKPFVEKFKTRMIENYIHLYDRNKQQGMDVDSRTGKWLLNILAFGEKGSSPPSATEEKREARRKLLWQKKLENEGEPFR